MKKPSVPSRCGIAGRSARGMSRAAADEVRSEAASAARPDGLVLRRRDRACRVDERPPGRGAAAAAHEDLALKRGQPLDRLGATSPARSGRAASVPGRSTAGPPGRGRSRRRGRSRASASTTCTLRARSRAHELAELRRAPGVALDRDDLAAVLHQGGEVRRLAPGAAQRSSTRSPGRGPSARAASTRRATGRDAPRRSGEAAPVDGPRGRAPRAARRRRARPRPPRQLGAPLGRSATSVFTRSAVSAGSLSAAISERASARRAASHHSRPARRVRVATAASSGVAS